MNSDSFISIQLEPLNNVCHHLFMSDMASFIVGLHSYFSRLSVVVLFHPGRHNTSFLLELASPDQNLT